MNDRNDNSNDVQGIVSSSIPWHMRSDFITKVQNIGNDGYDYTQTQQNLITATEKMLKHSNDIK